MTDIHDLNVKLSLMMHHTMETYKVRWCLAPTFLTSNEMNMVAHPHAPVALFQRK